MDAEWELEKALERLKREKALKLKSNPGESNSSKEKIEDFETLRARLEDKDWVDASDKSDTAKMLAHIMQQRWINAQKGGDVLHMINRQDSANGLFADHNAYRDQIANSDAEDSERSDQSPKSSPKPSRRQKRLTKSAFAKTKVTKRNARPEPSELAVLLEKQQAVDRKENDDLEGLNVSDSEEDKLLTVCNKAMRKGNLDQVKDDIAKMIFKKHMREKQATIRKEMQTLIKTLAMEQSPEMQKRMANPTKPTFVRGDFRGIYEPEPEAQLGEIVKEGLVEKKGGIHGKKSCQKRWMQLYADGEIVYSTPEDRERKGEVNLRAYIKGSLKPRSSKKGYSLTFQTWTYRPDEPVRTWVFRFNDEYQDRRNEWMEAIQGVLDQL